VVLVVSVVVPAAQVAVVAVPATSASEEQV